MGVARTRLVRAGPAAGLAAVALLAVLPGPARASDATLTGPDRTGNSAPCVIGADTVTCTSADPVLTAEWTNSGDTSGCSFSYTLNWGDGTSQSGTRDGGPAGASTLARHTYREPGAYTYTATGTTVRGDCRFAPGAALFSYTRTFTVSGSLPVLPGSSQDTAAQAAGASCSPARASRARAEGRVIAEGFALLGAPDAGTLLAHFLGGSGTPVNLGKGTQAASDLPRSPAFQALDRAVRAEIGRQLAAGRTRLTLASPVLRRIELTEPSDLYWAFRGTQGLTVTGQGYLTRRGWRGTLAYTVRDSFGFTPQDSFRGIGAAMRYLQVECGRPEHSGGARWFPDSVTATVGFRLPAR